MTTLRNTDTRTLLRFCGVLVHGNFYKKELRSLSFYSSSHFTTTALQRSITLLYNSTTYSLFINSNLNRNHEIQHQHHPLLRRLRPRLWR